MHAATSGVHLKSAFSTEYRVEQREGRIVGFRLRSTHEGPQKHHQIARVNRQVTNRRKVELTDVGNSIVIGGTMDSDRIRWMSCDVDE